MTPRETAVLIPAAGRVPDGVLSLSNISCPAMIPVAGRPVIFWTLRYLTRLGLERFSIAVPRRGLFLEDFVECTLPDGCSVDYVVPKVDRGVGRTVLELAESAQADSALVVLGDTHFRWSDPSPIGGRDPFVLVHEVDESYRWCIAESEPPAELATPGSRLARLHDKVEGLQAAPGSSLEALIGVYYFPELERLREACRAADDEASRTASNTELAPILETVHRDRPIRLYRADEWLDCGNPDRQASSHRSLLQERAFHRLSIDPILGTIRKESENAIDLRDEIEYFRDVPPGLQVLFPRVLAAEIAAANPSVTLEYYGYPTLSEVYVFDRLDPGLWDRIFEHLFQIVTEGFMPVEGPLADGALEIMYLEKTRARLERLRGQAPFDTLLDPATEPVVDGVPQPSWSVLWPAIERAVADLRDTLNPSFVHGDLHLGNILYDVRSGICKLIDPRGRFGDRGIYGDPRYDVAKLYHSLYGFYDLIVTDLFSVEYDGEGESTPPSIDLNIRERPQHGELHERFARRFFERFDREEILLLTGLLFVSMPPLHYDAPRRQLAMYARGLQLLTERFPELSPARKR